MATPSRDVQERVAATRRLAERVRALTTALETQTDAALLALTSWGSQPTHRQI